MLTRGKPATWDWTTWRQKVDGATREGRKKKMWDGYKGSQISDRQELPPQKRPLQGRKEGVGGWGRHVGAPATKVIGNLLASLLEGGGYNRCTNRRVPTSKEKSTLLRIPGNEKWVVFRGLTVGKTRWGQERIEWSRIYTGILLLW